MKTGDNKERIYLKKLFLDIETLPASGEQMQIIKDFFEEYKNKAGRKTILKQNTDPSTSLRTTASVRNDSVAFDEFYRNTSFTGEFGRIFCIGYAVDDQQSNCLSGDEKKMLEDFWQIAKNAELFIGHNIMEFDLRFIYKRSIIHRVRPTGELSFARYRNFPIFDTMKEWEKWGSTGASLHRLALALGIASPKNGGIDGSKVYDFFLAGETEKIIQYCKRDVETTREIYKRINFI